MAKWEKARDVDSPRLIAMLILCVAERRCAVPVTCLCLTCVLGHKNVLAPSAAERQDVMRWSSRISIISC